MATPSCSGRGGPAGPATAAAARAERRSSAAAGVSRGPGGLCVPHHASGGRSRRSATGMRAAVVRALAPPFCAHALAARRATSAGAANRPGGQPGSVGTFLWPPSRHPGPDSLFYSSLSREQTPPPQPAGVAEMSEQMRRVRRDMEEDENLKTLMAGLRGAVRSRGSFTPLLLEPSGGALLPFKKLGSDPSLHPTRPLRSEHERRRVRRRGC